ncbi:MAG: RimK-like ATPgrasp N-terminal domain-containing protein [Trueperaceae bacterium]|nr:RimK-like ATPgrasp N-terminal domain-containing protein [Trueperaceae bacterium]
MAGDYYYMSEAYYQLLEAELAAQPVLPTTADTLDAYVVPLALEKAKLAKFPVPEYRLVVDKLPTGVLAYSVNPFSEKMQVISEGDDLTAKLNSLSRTGKYAVCCQQLPADYRMDVLRCVLGHTLIPEYESYALELFKLFRLPLMRVRVIVTSEAYLFSAIEPLALKELKAEELGLLESLGTWQE